MLSEGLIYVTKAHFVSGYENNSLKYGVVRGVLGREPDHLCLEAPLCRAGVRFTHRYACYMGWHSRARYAEGSYLSG